MLLRSLTFTMAEIKSARGSTTKAAGSKIAVSLVLQKTKPFVWLCHAKT